MYQLLQLQVPEDHDAFAFAAHSWLTSYRAANDGGDDKAPPRNMAQYIIRRMPTQAYYEALRPVVQGELRRGFLLATLDDDVDNFQGFAAHRNGVLHYIYVKKWARRMGLASHMLRHLGPLSHCTQTWPWVSDWLARQRVPYKPEEAFRDR